MYFCQVLVLDCRNPHWVRDSVQSLIYWSTVQKMPNAKVNLLSLLITQIKDYFCATSICVGVFVVHVVSCESVWCLSMKTVTLC